MKVPWQLHLVALLVVVVTLAAETFYMFLGTKATIPDVLVGRILGTFDMSLALVLGYYFTASLAQNRPPQRSSDVPVVQPAAESPKGPA